MFRRALRAGEVQGSVAWCVVLEVHINMVFWCTSSMDRREIAMHNEWVETASVSCKPINGSALLIAAVDYASRTRVISATLLRYTTSCPEPPGPYAHSSPRMYSPDTLRSTASISSVLTATLDGSCTHPWSSLCSTHTRCAVPSTPCNTRTHGHAHKPPRTEV